MVIKMWIESNVLILNITWTVELAICCPASQLLPECIVYGYSYTSLHSNFGHSHSQRAAEGMTSNCVLSYMISFVFCDSYFVLRALNRADRQREHW